MSEAGDNVLVEEKPSEIRGEEKTHENCDETTPDDSIESPPVPEPNLGGENDKMDLAEKIDENDVLLPKLEDALLDETSRSNTPSEGNTPRGCDSSSGSPSPIPDDGLDGHQRPRVQLGRDISLMMQALNSLHSPEEKIAALCKKYADLLEQQKMKEKRLRGMDRKAAQGTKEREQLQKDLNKALLGKSKMESLARELNKQNKLLKQEAYNATLRHNKEREQVSAKFKAATDEISGKINSIAERNELLNEQNREMAEKMAKLVDETKARENTIKAMMQQRDLQEQILQLKLEKVEEERDVTLQQQVQIVEESNQAKSLCEGYIKQEKELKVQIAYYSEKFEDFQSTLDKSNKIFASFRDEMDRMNTKMRDLEKATALWKKNYEDSEAENKRITTVNIEQNRLNKNLQEKLRRLSNLCRALQTERNELAKHAQQIKRSTDVVTAEATSTIDTETPKISPMEKSESSPTVNGEAQPSETVSKNESESMIVSSPESGISGSNESSADAEISQAVETMVISDIINTSAQHTENEPSDVSREMDSTSSNRAVVSECSSTTVETHEDSPHLNEPPQHHEEIINSVTSSSSTEDKDDPVQTNEEFAPHQVTSTTDGEEVTSTSNLEKDTI